jgi:hypothetical protein
LHNLFIQSLVMHDGLKFLVHTWILEFYLGKWDQFKVTGAYIFAILSCDVLGMSLL